MTPEERYHHDPMFRSLVEMLYAWIKRAGKDTTREALDIATALWKRHDATGTTLSTTADRADVDRGERVMADYPEEVRLLRRERDTALEEYRVTKHELDEARASYCKASDERHAARQERDQLRQENIALHEEIKGNAIRRNELRAHVAALVGALDACRRTIGGRDEDHPVMEQADYVLRAPDLTALVERERMRDAVIEAARLSAPTGAPPWDVQKNLRQALATLDAPKPLEKENE